MCSTTKRQQPSDLALCFVEKNGILVACVVYFIYFLFAFSSALRTSRLVGPFALVALPLIQKEKQKKSGK